MTAHDADDEMFGMSAKLVYSISQGHPYFSVESNTGQMVHPAWCALIIILPRKREREKYNALCREENKKGRSREYFSNVKGLHYDPPTRAL